MGRGLLYAIYRIALVSFIFASLSGTSFAQSNAAPEWESLLWGGKISENSADSPLGPEQAKSIENPDLTLITPETPSAKKQNMQDLLHNLQQIQPVAASMENTSIIVHPVLDPVVNFVTTPYNQIVLKNIPPLYVVPELPGEGVWQSQGLPTGPDGETVMWRTSYRPSIEFPNAIVHMLLFDMKKLDMRLYIGSTEPGGSTNTGSIEDNNRRSLLAVTNALWKQKHSGEAGAIFRGKVIKPLAHGMATIVVYNDRSVDILEWNDSIPISLVSDARQLRHLIVKDGKVIDNVIKGGKPSDAEIGLGMLLTEESSNPDQGYQGWWGGMAYNQPSFTSGEYWYIATRSAFGIRKDGNLVFAAGHHISTKDLAKAMVLAGCERAIHADANPHNVLGNLYYQNGLGSILKRAKLSPEQRETLTRYDKSYTSDFFGFFLRSEERDS